MSKSKKILSFVLCLSLLVGFFVFVGLKFFHYENKSISLILTTNNITIEKNDIIDLKDYYILSPEQNNKKVFCLIENSSFAEIGEDNILTAKNLGTTKIYFKVKQNNNNYIEKTINLTIKEASFIPNSISFENEVVNLGLNTVNKENKMIVNGKYNINPNIEYSESNICSYSYSTGKIIPIAVGSTRITVKFELKGIIVSNSFTVNINKQYRTMEILETPFQDGYYVINTTNSYPIIAVVIKEGVNQVQENIQVEITKNENSTIIFQQELGNIVLQVLNVGESILKISCVDDETIFINVKVIKE